MTEEPTPPMEPTAPVLPTVENLGFDLSAQDLEGWEMIWEDNFDEGLAKWKPWNSGAFNNELQFYQASNLFVEQGYLFIEQAREQASGPANPFDNTTKNFSYTSGRIETVDLFGPQINEGTLRISARIKLPAGEGLWPAFWSYGDPWPTQGEIDIMEFRGGNTMEYISNFFYGVEANMPLTDFNATTNVYEHGSDLTTEFHVFEVVWSRDSFLMYFDGTLVKTYDKGAFPFVDDFFDKREQVVLNLAVGGNFFNGQNLDERDIPDESFLIVDWVKIFKQ